VSDSAAPVIDVVSEPRLVSVDQAMTWLVRGWQMFRADPGVWMAIGVVFGLIYGLSGVITMLGPLASALLTPVLLGGVMMGCAAQDRGEPLMFETLFAGFRYNTNNLVMVGVLTLVSTILMMLAAAALGFAGALLGSFGGRVIGIFFILVAAIAFLAVITAFAMALWYAAPLVALAHMTPVAAAKASFRACMLNWLPLSIYGLVIVVLFTLSVFTLFLGLLVLIPVLLAAHYASYRDIF
jgi:hypothetical protein